MTSATRFEFALAKAEYLLTHKTNPGVGGDKQNFWRIYMGFESAEAVREAILSKVSLPMLQLQGKNNFGHLYRAYVRITGPAGMSRRIRTVWIIRFNEDIARESDRSTRSLGRMIIMDYRLFDSVKLKEAISLTDGGMAAVGTVGAIVEVFNDGEAYLVELFGQWVKYDEQENFVPAAPIDEGSFMETIGVETVDPHQLELVQRASETVSVRGHLLSLLDELSAEKVAEVRDFAEFLQQKQTRLVDQS